jgi:hypothetical protein
MADGLSPERVIRALARPGLGDELHALGVRDMSTFGGADVYIPPEHESYIRERIDETLGPEAGVVPPPTKTRWRQPDPLDTEAVRECEAKLRERGAARAAGGRVRHELTLEQIGLGVGFDRERVRHAERLMKLGWPLQKRHPDFSAEPGFVRLPSVDKAASELGLSDDEKASRLAEKSLPLT